MISLLKSVDTDSYALVSGSIEAIGDADPMPIYLTIKSPVITVNKGNNQLAATVDVDDPAITQALNIGAAAAKKDHDPILEEVQKRDYERALKAAGIK